MGTGSFTGVESGRGVTLTLHPLLVPRSKQQSRAIPLLSLRAFVACKNDETNLLTDAVPLHAAKLNTRFGKEWYCNIRNTS
jgi:hypothetical protein